MGSNGDSDDIKNTVKEFDSLGKYLKYIRESNGITIDTVVVDTRIRKIYLEALEEEDYEVLPERTYALGYLRSYANYLNISNVEELVDYLDTSYDFYRPVYGDSKSSDEKSLFIKKKSLKSVLTSEGTINYISKKNKNNSLEAETKPVKEVVRGDAQESIRNKRIVLLLICVVVVLGVFVGVLVSVVAGNYNKAHNPQIYSEKEQKDLETIAGVVGDQDFVVVPQPEEEEQSTVNNSSIEDNNVAVLGNDIAAPNMPSVNNNIENNVNTDINATVRFPQETKARDISIVFFEDVWVKIYNTKDSNIVYVNKVFKAGSTYNVPGVEDLALDIGNYKGLYFVLNSTRIYLNKLGSGRVMKNILLDKDDLLRKYGE